MRVFSVAYMACAAALTIVFLYKFGDLRRRWSSPRLWSLCALFVFAALTFWFAAPSTIGFVNRATGVPNVSALIVYSLVVAIAASNILLGLYWRYPADKARPRVRMIIAAYVGVVVTMVVLFARSSVPVERRTDFDTYYATQPTVAAFLMVYLWATLIGMSSLAYLCFTWSASEAVAGLPTLRRGLRIFATAALCPAVFAVVKIVATVTAWSGSHALDRLSTAIPLLNIVGVLIVLFGVPVPTWGPAVTSWRTYLRLRPLHRALAAVNPDAVVVTPGKRLNPHHRVRRQRIELSDFRWALARHFDPAVRVAAQRYGEQAGLGRDQLEPIVQAAQLKAALASAHDTAGSARAEWTEPQDGANSDLAWWLDVAGAWNSPAVATVLGLAAGQGARR